jgi:lipoprotein-releasing system permease protein
VYFEWFVSLRYLKAKRRQGFISLITLISIGGVMVGVMALIIVLAVMTGFSEGLRDKILGINSHIVVQKIGQEMEDYSELADKIRALPGVSGVTPYIYSQTMISAGDGGTGAVLRGIDVNSASAVLKLKDQVIYGSLESLAKKNSPDKNIPPAIILGKELARQLRVSLNDTLRLILAEGPLTPIGIIPRVQTCRVTGIFETGMYEYDSVLAYVSLSTAQKFLGMEDKVNGLEVTVNDIYQAGDIAQNIEKVLGLSYVAKDWMRTNKNLFSALKLEKTALSIIVALIVLVAAFNIISTLIMMVMEKTRDIAIMKSMGASSAKIMRIFILEGLIIGSAGTILGVLGGLGVCSLLSRYHFIRLPDVYPMSTLPVKVIGGDVFTIAASAILITLFATLYPSWQASRVEPAVTLRYE